MSKQFVIINLSTKQIELTYTNEYPRPDLYHEYADPIKWVHVEFPQGANIAFTSVRCDAKGKCTFYEDAMKKREYNQSLLQLHLQKIRQQRNELLSASDWTVSVPDAPLSEDQKKAWKRYRQLLRDITKTINHHTQMPNWPTPPK
jgi:hypothetical protein